MHRRFEKMAQMTIRLSECYEDIAVIHDALYNYNLSKTMAKRIEVHAKQVPEQFALLACDEHGLSHGGIAFHWKNGPRRVFVDYFFLEEDMRGKGAGKALFEEFMRRVKRDGAHRIELTTNTFQAPGFYQKMGFRITGEHKAPSPGCPENIHYAMSCDL